MSDSEFQSSIIEESSDADFEFIENLGAGTFGTVSKVLRRQDEKECVIKKVRLTGLTEADSDRAINEVRILGGLENRFIVSYFDSYVQGGALKIVMEYCNHGDLSHFIEKKKDEDTAYLDENVTWNIGLQIMLGLHYLHRQNVLHRDLKTANVFLHKNNPHDSDLHLSVKIGDLGVAKVLDSTGALASSDVGTPYYQSPELYKGEPYRDKSDCWALGVILYECCTMLRPFEADNRYALWAKIIDVGIVPDPPREGTVSSELWTLIEKLLKKDPNERPQIKDLLRDKFIKDKGLIMASEKGDIASVIALLEEGADVDKADDDGTTALMMASANGHATIVEALLEAGADVDKANSSGDTALMQASGMGHTAIVKALLKAPLQAGATIDKATYNGHTALMAASQQGHAATVKVLLEEGADVDMPNSNDGTTALIWASGKGHAATVEVLLQVGADVDKAANTGLTALMWASGMGHTAIVETLILAGADVNRVASNGTTAMMMASANGHGAIVEALIARADVDKTNNDGNTALMWASANGHAAIVEALIQAEADVDKANSSGDTALMWASRGGHLITPREFNESLFQAGMDQHNVDNTALPAPEDNYPPVVEALIFAGADVNKTNNHGTTALMMACMEGHTAYVKVLIRQKEAEIDKTDYLKRTALMWASEKGHRSVVGSLLQADKEDSYPPSCTPSILFGTKSRTAAAGPFLEEGLVNMADCNGRTALLLASMQGHTDIVKDLLEAEAYINKADHEKGTALILASKMGHADIVKELLEKDPNMVNMVNIYGDTALMMASEKGHAAIVEVLIQAGADVDKANSSGDTALMQASGMGHAAIVKVLIQAGADIDKANKEGKTARELSNSNGHADIETLLDIYQYIGQ